MAMQSIKISGWGSVTDTWPPVPWSDGVPARRGVWRDDERGATLLDEQPVIVFSYAAEAALSAEALGELYKALSRMGRETNQGEIGVVIDGKYYGISEYAAE